MRHRTRYIRKPRPELRSAKWRDLNENEELSERKKLEGAECGGSTTVLGHIHAGV